MRLSWLVSSLFCGQLLVAAVPTGSAGRDLPRIKPRSPQKGEKNRGKGFLGGGFGALAEALGTAPKEPETDPKAGLAKAPKGSKGSTNPSTATSPPATGTGDPVGDVLAALGTASKGPSDGLKPTGNSVGDAFGTSGSNLTPSKGMLVTITGEAIKCRRYPDTVTPESANLPRITRETHLRVTCWTSASMPGASGKVLGSSVWLRTDEGCYLPEMNIASDANFEKKLATCEPIYHLVGTMQTQYTRQDCYSCTNTNCKSRNIGAGSLIDLGCTATGQATGGNSTWVKHATESCFFPGAIFQPQGWLGRDSVKFMKKSRLPVTGTGGGYCAPGVGTGIAGGVGSPAFT
ncbi:hypothetical protein FKW77_007415 [Venturia effusa]|uniref:Cyanovirin-N domain-containing protein n=1 Tax=Venturia effusa TaxID=50376 RepID=A0A517L1K9_9PEZI|nr:hypothetical protein FKW77_007415 [Venturia effusa]